MALLDFTHQLFGRNKLWATTVGSADLPTSGGIGDWNAGDIVYNLAPGAGAPSFWFVSAVSATGTPTFLAAAVNANTNIIRSVAGSATLAATDYVLFITAAGTVTLPAPASSLANHKYSIKATAQPVTINPASGNLDGAALPFTISTQQEVEVLTDGTSWFSTNRDLESGGPVRAITPPGTVFATDSYVTSTAGQLTLAPTAGWPIGRGVGVVALAASVTITPTSGNINGVAANTLGNGARAIVVCDGTNFFVY